jgi:hypothetical protein
VKRLLVLATLLLATGAWAAQVYVVVLRNGNRIVAREKYTVKGSNALVVLKNGTLTAIPLDQIDVPLTDTVNGQNLGDAQLLEWVDITKPLPTPAPTPSLGALGQVRRGLAVPSKTTGAAPTPTPGLQLRGERSPDAQVELAFQEGLERSHLYLYRMSRGSKPGNLYVEAQVNGQAEVLRALQAITSTYHIMMSSAAERAPKEIEIKMLNESGKEAGLFQLTPADAAELATGKISAEDFFVTHVIF